MSEQMITTTTMQVVNQLCVIVGDVVKDGHNYHVTNELLGYGFDVALLYSNYKDNGKDIKSLFHSKYENKLSLFSIDLMSGSSVNDAFGKFESKIDEMGISVLIYNGALKLSGLEGEASNKEEEKKDESGKEKEVGASLTFEQTLECDAYCVNSFLYCIKNCVSDSKNNNKNEKRFSVIYSVPQMSSVNLKTIIDKGSSYGIELMKSLNSTKTTSGNSSINLNTKRISKNDIINQVYNYNHRQEITIGNSDDYLLGWANNYWYCNISTQLELNGDTLTYYLSPSNMGSGTRSITLTTTEPSSEWAWRIGTYYNANGRFSRNFIIANMDSNNETLYGLTMDSSTNGDETVYSIMGNSSIIFDGSGNTLWRLLPVLPRDNYDNFGKKFVIYNLQHTRAITVESGTSTLATTAAYNGATVWDIVLPSDGNTSTAIRNTLSDKDDIKVNAAAPQTVPTFIGNQRMIPWEREKFCTQIGYCNFRWGQVEYEGSKYKKFKNQTLAIVEGTALVSQGKIGGFTVNQDGTLFYFKELKGFYIEQQKPFEFLSFIATDESPSNYSFQIGVNYDSHSIDTKEDQSIQGILSTLQASVTSRCCVTYTEGKNPVAYSQYKEYNVPFTNDKVKSKASNYMSIVYLATNKKG